MIELASFTLVVEFLSRSLQTDQDGLLFLNKIIFPILINYLTLCLHIQVEKWKIIA